MSNAQDLAKIKYAYPSDQKEAIPILIHPLLDKIIDRGRTYDLNVMLAGGTARRMVLGINPLNRETDLDIVISSRDPSTVPTWKSGLAFQAAVERLTNISVDLLNFDGNKWYPQYEKFKLSNPPSINRLLISKQVSSDEWWIDDYRNGIYLTHVREKRIQLVETRHKLFWCDLRDALNFLRLILEFPEILIDSKSMALIKEFTRRGKVGFHDREISFVEFMKEIFEVRQETEPGAINIPRNPFLSLFSLFIHAKETKQVIPLLEQMGLKEPFEQFVNLNEAERISLEKKEKGELVTHAEFDRTFKIPPDTLNCNWTGLFNSCNELEEFVLSQLSECLNDHKPSLTRYIQKFTAEFLCPFIPQFNATVLINRIAILNNLLSIFPKYLLTNHLEENWYSHIAHLFPKDILDPIIGKETSIRAGINEGRFLNLLDYLYRDEETTSRETRF